MTASPGSSRRGGGCPAAAVALLLCLLAGCAHPPGDRAAPAVAAADYDPLEPLNRKTFSLNQLLDRLLFRPVAKIYVTVVPEPGRKAIHRILANLREPTTVLNDLLQGEIAPARVSLTRFALNTSFGLGGTFDIASGWGLKRQPADFGQTLYVWGVPSGPYLVLPLFGPSDPRDTLGMVTDSYVDPLTFLANAKGLQSVEIGRLAADGVDQRAGVLDELDALEKNSLDFYAELRSLWQQRRAAELRRGAAAATPNNFYDVPAAAPAR